MLTLAALCDMNNTLFLTLAAVINSWDESAHLPRLSVLATSKYVIREYSPTRYNVTKTV